MAKYILNLGFNWDANFSGTMVDGANPQEYKPLQMGLANESTASFYQFENGDTLQFSIFNIGSTTGVSPTWFAVNLANVQLADGSGVAASMDVLTPAVPSDATPCESFSGFPASSSPAFDVGKVPSWELIFPDPTPQFTFDVNSDVTCELSMMLIVTHDTDPSVTATFVGDPEMWIRA